jgi:hypothetical protein
MTATVTSLHPGNRSVATVLAERRQHAAAMKACDQELSDHFEQAAADLEEVCTAIAETDLAAGVREEARQLALDLPERIQRVQRASVAR